MQNLDLRAFCQPCQRPTNHQIRYRSDPDFVGRVLTCENYGQRVLEPLGPGTCCQDWYESTPSQLHRTVGFGEKRTSGVLREGRGLYPDFDFDSFQVNRGIILDQTVFWKPEIARFES